MDAYTLTLATGIAAAIMAMTMALLHNASPRETCLLDWAMVGILNVASNGVAMLMMALHIDSFLMPALINTLYIAGHYAILAGLRRHFGLAPRWRPVALLALAILATHLSGYAQASVTHRLMLFYPVIITLNIFIIKLLWRAPDNEARPAYRALLVLESAFLLQTVLRFGFILFGDPSALTPGGSQFLQTSGSLATFIFLSVATMSCALIVIRHQEVALRRASLTDSLTGWLNRRALQDIAEREFLRCRRIRAGMSFMIFDIDHFKSVNDRHGHAIGDAAIRHVTDLAAHAMRGYDGLFRIGGEEFAVIVAGVTLEELLLIGERLRALIADQPLVIDDKTGRITVGVTVSVGLATLEHGDAGWESILRRADDALYRAKKNGRNQVNLYHHSLAENPAERRPLQAAA
ncbi:diguanylate cyclase [Rugamonas sp.]|uniref:GGDEF domain-containing protein n=1 Tax=Rugamonas sp. TaxID=1926287 RepID=UPI0025F1F047|nr:GGDEF domain-containing protein [Rugamonas sp.]